MENWTHWLVFSASSLAEQTTPATVEIQEPFLNISFLRVQDLGLLEGFRAGFTARSSSLNGSEFFGFPSEHGTPYVSSS